jgi:ketosteroid isomerase-like protein
LNAEWFGRYANEFNHTEDKSKFFDNYYDPEVEFIHPFKGVFEGKQALVDFWNSGKNSGHAGIHEVISFRNVVVQGDRAGAELDIRWECFRDTDYLGPRKTGDVFFGRCAAFYEFVNGKIRRVRLYLNVV